MANSIHVTACDNELVVIAYQWGGSFELCRILSGNNMPVDLTLNITAGPYQGSMNFSDVSSALGAKLNTCLPAGAYSLLLMGVNWGGPTNFMVNVNGVQHNSAGGSAVGLVYNPGPIAITV